MNSLIVPDSNDPPAITLRDVMWYVSTLLVGVFLGFVITIGSIAYALSESTASIQMYQPKGSTK